MTKFHSPCNYIATELISFLHIISYNMQSSGGASVTCNSEYINQLNLVGDLGDEEGGVNPTVGMGTAGGRRKRDTVKRTLKKRQEAPAEQEVSENVTLVSRSRVVKGRVWGGGSLMRDPWSCGCMLVGS